MEESGSEGKNSRWGQVLFLVSMYRKLMRPLEECFRGRCTSHQLWAILTLEAAGPMPVGQLAEAMRVTKQQMSRMVEGLVEEGLLFRKADPSDGRRLLVGLSHEARQILNVRWHDFENRADGLLSALNEEERTEFDGAVATLNRLFERLPLAVPESR